MTLVRIPTTVEAAAIKPISSGLALRNLAKRERVGDLDMVELKIAKAPKAQRTANSLVKPSRVVAVVSLRPPRLFPSASPTWTTLGYLRLFV